MKRLLAILTLIAVAFSATAQITNSIVLDRSTFRAVQTDALTGVNVDPIGVDRSRRACARLKIFFHRMTREQMAQLEPVFPSGTIDYTKCKVAEGNTVLILEFTARPQVKFYLKHPTFGTSNEVTFDYEGNKEYQMEASLNQTFSIVVNSNVAGADVYLDGVYKGKTDSTNSLTVKDVMIGVHKLKLTYGSVTNEQSIEVNDSSISFRQDVNTAANEPQFVVFTVEPSSAVVTIDGQHYSLTDGAMNVVLDSGTYNYTVSAAGYHSQSGTFTVSGSKVTRSVSLSADAATVTLTVANNAEIWVNGVMKGTGRWSGTLNSGTYIFEAKRAGHKTVTLSKHITSSQPQQSYTLPAPTPIIGSLIVSGTPINADVVLDGKSVGQLPVKLNDILVGEHKLTVSKSGYQPYTATVTVTEGKTATVNAELKKQVAQQVKPAPTTKQTSPTPQSKSTPVPQKKNDGFGGIEMVFVKGGTFTMGATAEQGSDVYSLEKPTHSVTLSDYYIGKYEVTQAQWRAVMGINPSRLKGDNLPVECVSWDDIQLFIHKLNEKTGKKFRLPTEAEWEYAARGGSKSKGYKYSGSNSLTEVAWCADNSGEKPHTVGGKRPNELGIYDMSGNVWEWCSDWRGEYNGSSQTNPKGASSGSRRVCRGGAFNSFSASYYRVSYRSGMSPNYRGQVYGFRLVCAVE